MSRSKSRSGAKGGTVAAARSSAKPHAARATSSAAAATQRRRGPTLAGWLPPLLVIGAGLIAYYNSFAGVFLLDDKFRIVSTAHVRQLWPRGRRWHIRRVPSSI
jgi:hypothetical protein